MTESEFETMLSVGEHIGVEFKRAQNGVKEDTFETVCSFLNRFGGDIFLGVEDDGTVIGIPDGAVESTIKNILNVVNNPNLLNPVFYVYSEVLDYHGKKVIRIHVPQGSDVHRYKGVCYDRVAEADVQVKTSDQIAEMYIRKRNVFTERKLFPYIKREHLRLDLLPVIRNLIYSKFAVHPWLKLSDEELLSIAGLYEEDFVTGKRAFNAAAVLLLGRDDVIFSCFPAYKTDAILRKVNLDRYDDRVTVTCNLVEAYDQLMAFGAKHLLDKFYLENGSRVSLRDKILREVVGNTLIHREYSSAYPASLVINADMLKVENASKALKCGPLTPETFSPMSKNPIIARFFNQMGRADELGSGMRNLYRYVQLYSGKTPALKEGDTFITQIPLDGTFSMDQLEGVCDPLNDRAGSLNSQNVHVNGENVRVNGENVHVNGGNVHVNGRSLKRKERIKQLYQLVAENPGINHQQLAKILGVTPKTIVRYAQALKGKIRYQGSDKTGGYHIVEE